MEKETFKNCGSAKSISNSPIQLLFITFVHKNSHFSPGIDAIVFEYKLDETQHGTTVIETLLKPCGILTYSLCTLTW